MSRKVTPMMSSCWPLMISPPRSNDISLSVAGNVRGVGETIAIIVYSRRKDTPIAVMSTEMRGAWRSGRYASRSTTTPSRDVTAMEMRIAGTTGIPSVIA